MALIMPHSTVSTKEPPPSASVEYKQQSDKITRPQIIHMAMEIHNYTRNVIQETHADRAQSAPNNEHVWHSAHDPIRQRAVHILSS